jgi:hypothetical protein
MTIVYAAIAVAVVLVVGGLLLFNWSKQRELEAAVATPTPAPAASGKPTPAPIQLADGTVIGKPLIKLGKISADTAAGGQGQDVDGIQCAGMEFAALHIHPHLAIFYKGQQVEVPPAIGGAIHDGAQCLYWLHTHDGTGLIHIEAPQLTPPGGAAYTLGILFDIWGQPLTRDNIAGLRGPVTAYVNGEKFDGDLVSLPLRAHEQIVLEVGTPVVPPPNYAFPPND